MLPNGRRGPRARGRGGITTGDRFDAFTARAKRALGRAQTEARRRHHTHIGPEHLLLGLTGPEAGTAAQVLATLGVDRRQVQHAVEGTLDRGRVRVRGSLRLTPGAKRVIRLAVEEADRLRHTHIGTEHLLLGLLCGGDRLAAGALQRLGVTPAQVRAQLQAASPPPSGSES